ncbi:MAG TPA: peptide chain release factor 1 [Candidatus Sulfomarinibacteraceae bacterium]|nr:peptide chain release factor 1 [Candidatus Sulfomarinibacteraceae bacterium]
MFDKIAKIVRRYEDLEKQMVDPEVLADHVKLTELAQERSDLQPLVEAYRQHQALLEELEETRDLLEMSEDPEMVAMAEEEVAQLERRGEQLKEKMRRLLIPKDPRDEKNVFIEIRAGAGGDEAAIFAGDLLRMYTRYAENQNWRTEVVDANEIGVGGYKEVVLAVKGRGAFSRFKFESGVHRVQRVPITESQGRIHTSTATVAVLPEMEDVEVNLNPDDLDITSTFASGPGGQHMQKNATAIRVVHKPTGMTVNVQSERSQTQNKRVALSILQARLQEIEEEKQHAERAADRRSQVGTGDRSEKIRTYNYPQSRVTDHRIGYSSYNLPTVMDGDLDPFIQRLTIADQAEKLAAVSEE